MLVSEENLDVLKEVTNMLTEHNILVKCMKDDDFNVMFNVDCANVDVDMSDETFLTIAKMAHEEDITFNQKITNILRKQIEKEENEKYKSDGFQTTSRCGF